MDKLLSPGRGEVLQKISQMISANKFQISFINITFNNSGRFEGLEQTHNLILSAAIC